VSLVAISYADTTPCAAPPTNRASLPETGSLQHRARHHPQTIIRAINDSLATVGAADYLDLTEDTTTLTDFATQADLDTYINNLESDMREAANKFEFEKAVKLRDTVKDLRTKESLFT
jgi:excinuclease UvrABC helicase subunit UvrB